MRFNITFDKFDGTGGPIRTFADLRLRAITTWVQPISMCLPTATGGHEVLLCVDDDTQSLPMPLFEYELVRLFKEGTAAGGRKWWHRASTHGKVLRCAWHIVNRAMYRLFGSATRDWQRTFEKIF